MIAKALRLGKGIRLQKSSYIEIILDSGTEEYPNLVHIYINIKCEPEKFLGKEVSIPINIRSFIKSPMGDNKTIIISDEMKLA